MRHRCLYFGVFFRNSNWNSDLNPPSNFCISVLIIKYVAVATSIPHQHSQNWQKCCFNTYVQYNDIRECVVFTTSANTEILQTGCGEKYVCVCVCTAHTFHLISSSLESPDIRRKVLSLSASLTLCSVYLWPRNRKKTHIYINRPV